MILVGSKLEELSTEELAEVNHLIADYTNTPRTNFGKLDSISRRSARAAARKELYRNAVDMLDKLTLYVEREEDGKLKLIPQSEAYQDPLIPQNVIKLRPTTTATNPEGGTVMSTTTTEKPKNKAKNKAEAKVETKDKGKPTKATVSAKAKGDFSNDQTITLVKAPEKGAKLRARYDMLKSGITVAKALEIFKKEQLHNKRQSLRSLKEAGYIRIS